MAVARAAVECAYEGVRGGFKDLMVLSGKDVGGFPRRAGVVTIVEIYRYIYLLDESLMGRWIRINENEEGNIGRKMEARITHLLCLNSWCCVTLSYTPSDQVWWLACNYQLQRS